MMVLPSGTTHLGQPGRSSRMGRPALRLTSDSRPGQHPLMHFLHLLERDDGLKRKVT